MIQAIDSRLKTQDPRPKTQDPRPKTQDPRLKTQDSRQGLRRVSNTRRVLNARQYSATRSRSECVF